MFRNLIYIFFFIKRDYEPFAPSIFTYKAQRKIPESVFHSVIFNSL